MALSSIFSIAAPMDKLSQISVIRAKVSISAKGELPLVLRKAVFYVSPDGSDNSDGSVGSPFATLEKARDEVRKINGSMSGDIIVYLRGGDYRITKPVEFDTRDSGNGGFTVRYEAYNGETPVINGAQKVTGWKKYNDKLWSAPLDRDIKLRNLYVNDKRADMGSVQVQAKGGYGDYYVVLTTQIPVSATSLTIYFFLQIMMRARNIQFFM